MKKTSLLIATFAASVIGIASASPANATPPCPVNYELQSDGFCHFYGSQPTNGYDPSDPSGKGFLRGFGPDSSWE